MIFDVSYVVIFGIVFILDFYCIFFLCKGNSYFKFFGGWFCGSSLGREF